MGEAKRKKQLAAKSSESQVGIQPDKLAAAVRQVVGAMTDFHGADCLLFSSIGAGALRHLGLEDARPVAGSAAWRVGPGDSDTISHAREVQGPLYMQAVSERALQFHAWVEAPGLLADFSMSTLRHKAAQLDAADGGTTAVDWAPEYLWLAGTRPPEMLRSPKDVNQSYQVGVYSYVRHPDIEHLVLADLAALMSETAAASAAAVAAYRALCAGHTLRIASVSEDSTVQTEPQFQPLTAIDGTSRGF